MYWYWMVLAWVLLSVLAAWSGRQKRIGFVAALLVSLILSPILGFILVSLSKHKSKDGERESRIDNSNA